MDGTYVLGHSGDEVRRLELQATLFAPGTERMLNEGGLRPGMSVLDVGTGAGDVAMMAAAIVGRSGAVLGIDRDPSVLERARSRASTADLPIRFEVAALDAAMIGGPFDAVVGRYVLAHQSDPVAFLRRTAGLLRPGGLLLFIEPGLPEPSTIDATIDLQCSHPRVALVEETFRKILLAFTLAGAHVGCGGRLGELFEQADIVRPSLRREALTGEPGSALPEWLGLTLRSLLPVLERHGVAQAHTTATDSLESRLEAAMSAARARVEIPDMLCCGWARID